MTRVSRPTAMEVEETAEAVAVAAEEAEAVVVAAVEVRRAAAGNACAGSPLVVSRPDLNQDSDGGRCVQSASNASALPSSQELPGLAPAASSVRFRGISVSTAAASPRVASHTSSCERVQTRQ